MDTAGQRGTGEVQQDQNRQELARVIVLNEQGLHVRPCNTILTLVQAHESELFITKLSADGSPASPETNAKSATSLLLLEAPQGTELQLRALGPDCEELIADLVEIFARRFSID